MFKYILFSFVFSVTALAQWQWSGNGLWPENGNQFNRQVLSIVSHQGNLLAVNTYGHLARSSNQGADWDVITVPGFPADPYIKVLYSTGTRLLAGIDGVYYSDDNGSTFTKVEGTTMTVSHFYTLGNVIWAAGQFPHYSSDNGETWTTQFTGPWSLVGANVSSYAADDAGNFYFAASNRRFYKSTDNGMNWESVTISGLPNTGSGFGDMTFYNGLLLATYGGNHGVVYSSNGGADWLQAEGFTTTALKNANKFEKLGDRVIIGTAMTTMISDETGTSWTPLDAQDTNPFLDFAQLGNYLFGGRSSGGVYKRDITTSSADEPAIVNGFKLLQNYPNPFNPATTIEFHLSESENVELKIFDFTGKEVLTLFKGYKNAGVHTVSFNAEGLASGIYVYRLNAGAYSGVKKLILLK